MNGDFYGDGCRYRGVGDESKTIELCAEHECECQMSSERMFEIAAELHAKSMEWAAKAENKKDQERILWCKLDTEKESTQ